MIILMSDRLIPIFYLQGGTFGKFSKWLKGRLGRTRRPQKRPSRSTSTQARPQPSSAAHSNAKCSASSSSAPYSPTLPSFSPEAAGGEEPSAAEALLRPVTVSLLGAAGGNVCFIVNAMLRSTFAPMPTESASLQVIESVSSNVTAFHIF